ncbi:MAG: VanW family protein, partial [Anaerolineales bacterium]
NKVGMNSKQRVIKQLLLAIPLSLIIFGLLMALLLIGFEVVYAERIYPGVYVYGTDLSGMSLAEASQKLADQLPYTYEGLLTFTYQDQVWSASPIDLGYLVEPTASAMKAFEVGRAGWLPMNLLDKGRAWFEGVQLSPDVYYDERIAQRYLQDIASEIDQPVIEASLGLENTQVVVKNGQVGREVDVSATLAQLPPFLLQMQNAVIPLVVNEIEPAIIDVGLQAELAREILSQPLVLQAADDRGDDETWTISPQDLAPMLMIARIDGGENERSSYQISLNDGLFRVFLNSIAPGLSIEPVNTRFIFNDETALLKLLEPAVIGRTLDIEASIAHIDQELQDGAHEITLQFETLLPEVTDDMTGEMLGITELVHQETSYFYGSDTARVQNIRTAAAQFHGLLIPPGATFSMAQALGNISLENGYAEALIIYGGQTIQGVGGGVCQVSTTLFRAAFITGFPIVERHAHAYRVSYYELQRDGSRDPNLAGLDATVFVPLVDLKFTNDTEYWLLMETYMGQYTSLTWKFYSTKDGRTVDWQTTGPTNIIPAPEPLYRENPELEKGELKKVDYAADGAEITVTRTVYKDDQVLFSDSFYTKFRPWQEIWEYGPGTEDIPESGTN